MKAVLVMAVAGMLCACASGNADGDQAKASYTLDHGVATYDALKAATEKCKAEGGVITLRSGYDNRELSNYDCRIGGSR